MDSENQKTLNISDLSRGGSGVAREESGRVIFVPLTLPGDRVRARILSADKRYAQAELVEILEPSPARQKPPCPVFGRCGGCQWQHVPYAMQWETKVRGVMHALARLKIEAPELPEQLPAERIWNYRNRIQLRGYKEELGFYAAKSHEIVSIDSCAIAREEINRVLPSVLEEGRTLTAPYKVEVEVLPSGEVRKSWNSRHAAAGFRQIHDEQNEKLRSWVSREISQSKRILDLYGGSGNLGAPVSVFSESVDCVDVSAPDEAADPQFPNLRFHRKPVLSWLLKTAKNPGAEFHSAILDPPREGLAEDFPKIATSLEALNVRELIAVGCDPDSWTRDLNSWVRRGWRIQKIAILDLFPQTPHVESLARLTRPA